LKVEEFDELCTKIESRYPEYEAKRLHREDRIKAIGQGRTFKLELRDRLSTQLGQYLNETRCFSYIFTISCAIRTYSRTSEENSTHWVIQRNWYLWRIYCPQCPGSRRRFCASDKKEDIPCVRKTDADHRDVHLRSF